MSISAQHAMKQASDTAHEYARRALSDLSDMLGISPKDKAFAAYAPVWAAMIAAASQDFNTACMSGAVDGLPNLPGRTE